MPIYLENVRGYSATIAGSIILPMVATQGIGSVLSGLVISRTGHYNTVLIASQFVWAGGLIAQAFYSRTTPISVICVVGFVQGLGTGGCFQPSLVAILAHSRRADRAVLSSLRNFLRTMGGTLGLTIAGTILSNTMRTRLGNQLSSNTIDQLATSTYVLESMNLTDDQKAAVLDAYMQGIRTIFIVYAPLVGACAFAALLVRDNGLAEKDTSTSLPAEVKAEARGNNAGLGSNTS